MPQSALDRAIRKLVDEEGDGDFDKQVADLIVAEAREKNDKGSKKIWRDEVPRRHATNTRFLNNVVRGVQSHNHAVLVHGNPANESFRKAPKRSDLIDSSLASGSRSKVDLIDDNDGNQRICKSRGVWSNETEEASSSSSTKGRTRPSSPKSSSYRQELSRGEEKNRRHRRRSEREGEIDTDERIQRRKHRHSHRQDNKETSTKVMEGSDDHTSKMDRYFDEKYDPKLDVRAEIREDENGLIEDDGWDRMLAALKEKEERRRARRERPKESKKSQRTKKEEIPPRVGIDLMDIQYTSRGKEREWDKGKG